MKLEYTEYEVFVSTSHSSDVLTFGAYDEALKEAIKWKSEQPKGTVIIQKVTREIVKGL